MRIPAALCGIVGLMPSRQRMPREGQITLCYSVGCSGVLSMEVQDAALVYAVITQTSAGRFLPDKPA